MSKEWLVILPDGAGKLSQRMEVRPQHLAATKPHVQSGKLVLGGAMLEEHPAEGAPLQINGSVMLYVAESRDEVVRLVQGDVYHEKGVWDLEKMQIIPFKSALRSAL